MNAEIVIRDTQEPDIPKLNAVLNSVVAERKYLALVTPIPLQSSEKFITNCLQKKYPNVVAQYANDIVGWCDISAREPEEYSHVGRLGMGIAGGYRGAGLGRRLITAAIERARKFGFEKIELDVYHDNLRARALYNRVGFEIEGVIKRYRKLDGVYQDSVLMAIFLNTGEDRVTPDHSL